MSKLTVYQYPHCSTCRKALKWLDEHGVAYQSVHIVDQPPSTALLKKALKAAKLPLKNFFNTSGESYRTGNFKERLPLLSEDEALRELAADGKLIKRPLLLGEGVVLVGFDPETWKATLG